MRQKYDVICIGSGPGGYSAAIKLAQLGKSVAVLDYSKDAVGGVCLNEGCIPIKSMIKISQIQAEIKNHGQKYGLNLDVKKPDIKKIVSYSKNVSATLRKGILYLFKKNNISFIEGEARLLSANEVEIKHEDKSDLVLQSDNIILATGSRPLELPKLKFDKKEVISSKEAIKLDRLPESILIVGAGAVGVEFASLFNNLGSKVTLVELQENILPHEDKEIASGLQSIFKKEGIDIYTKCKVDVVENKINYVKVKLLTSDMQKEIRVQKILVAAGRCANIDSQSLSNIGIEIKDGFVKVDECMRTTKPNIYAVGDITPYPMFAHSAYRESEIAALSIVNKSPQPINCQEIPIIIYSNIEVARLGLTESMTKIEGLDCKVVKHYFKSNGRSVLSNYEEGFVKIIADKKTRQFIGVHILGHEASELIHQFAICKSNNLTVDDIAKVIYGHPTFSEIVQEASRAVFGKPLHG